MSIQRFKHFYLLPFLGLVLFLGFHLGGQYLHEKLHHHENRAAQEECPVFQLIVQSVLLAGIFALVHRIFFAVLASCVPVLVLRSQVPGLPLLRAPPVVF
jgi:hypothetical protein